MRRIGVNDRFRWTLGDDSAARLRRFGAKVDDPIGRRDQVEVVLNHDHRSPCFDELVQDMDKPIDLTRSKTDRRFIKQIQPRRAAGPG